MNGSQVSRRFERITRFWMLLGMALTVLLFVMPPVNAQQLTGTLSGIVQDQSGALVPGAMVTLTNQKSGDIRTTVSGSSGHFVITAVQPATYSVTITAKGFKTWNERNIVITVGASLSIPNINLVVGNVSQKIVVMGGGAAGVPTDTPALSQTLNENVINNFPLTGRDAGELLKVMPGIAINGSNGGQSTFNDQEVGTNSGPVGDYVSNGTMPYGTMAYMLNGADIVDPGNFGTQIANMNPDMISSVKLLIGNYGAEFAKGPTIFQAFSKTGGLHYHGEAYLYTHNSVLNSVDAYTKSQGGTNAAQHYYYMGGNIGGPVRLPFTDFNTAKKRLFFWVGYEYMLQQPAGSILNYNVPNAAQLSGDFSNPGISQDTINAAPDFYRELTKNFPAGGSQTSVPTADEDPNGKAILALYPKTNETPSASNGYHNYKYVNQSPQNRWEASGAVDYSLSDNTKLTGIYTYQKEKDLAPISIWWAMPDTLPYPSPAASNTVAYVVNLNLTHVFNATTTNETVFSMSHFVNPYQLANPSAVSRKTVGFNVPGLFGHTTDQIPNFDPEYCCGSVMGSFNYYPMDGGFGGVKEVPAFYDNFTKVVGNHTYKIGFYWDDSRNSQNSNAPDNGTYNIETYGQNSTGNLVADMMLGNINSYQQQNKDYPNDTQYRQVAFYVQDSWRATPRLNLNYGVRFDHIGQWTAIGSDPGFQVFSMANYNADPTANDAGLLWHAKDPSIPSSGFVTPLFFYSPRVGFAYDIFGTGRTVVRAGFGVYRFQATSETASAENGPLGSFLYTTPTPFDGYANISTFTPPSAVYQNGSTVDAMQLGDDREPFTNDWNFTIDQALPHRSLLQVSYVGNRSGNEYMDGSNSNLYNLNNVPNGGFFKPDPLTGNLVSPAAPPCSTTDPSSESLYCANDPAVYSQTFNANDWRPMQTYQNVYLLTHAPYSNYNGLQISFTKESGPFTLVANYTFSKALGIRDGGSNNGQENGSAVNPFDLRANYGPLDFDRTQIYNFTVQWTLPNLVKGNGFGRRILEGAANGWQLSSYTSYQSGEPMAVNTGGFFNATYPSNLTVPTVAHPDLPDNSITLPNGLKAVAISASTYFGSNAYTGSGIVPDVTCNPTKNLHHGQRFNPACFAPPAPGQNGHSPLPYIHEPAYFDSDLGIYKDFHLTQSRYIQIRVSATNWLNHPLPQFGLAGNSDEQLNFIGTKNATCAGCVDANGNPLQIEYLSPTNTNVQTTGKPAFKTGARFVTLAAKYYF